MLLHIFAYSVYNFKTIISVIEIEFGWENVK